MRRDVSADQLVLLYVGGTVVAGLLVALAVYFGARQIAAALREGGDPNADYPGSA